MTDAITDEEVTKRMNEIARHPQRFGITSDQIVTVDDIRKMLEQERKEQQSKEVTEDSAAEYVNKIAKNPDEYGIESGKPYDISHAKKAVESRTQQNTKQNER